MYIFYYIYLYAESLNKISIYLFITPRDTVKYLMLPPRDTVHV